MNDKNKKFQKQKLLLNLLSRDSRFENNFNDDQNDDRENFIENV